MAQKTRVLAVVGARPNIMKTAPELAELERRGDRFESSLVHTGQHYDDALSQVFLDELRVRPPSHVLGVGSGSHAEQVARVMERLDPVLVRTLPDLVLVAGDVNSTVAAALTAVQRGLPVGHIEAGLRSFDRSMPEEVNRVVTDAVSTLHFIHSPEARANLLREGIAGESIAFVGNTMIDTLTAMRERPEVRAAPAAFGLEPGKYLLVTLHRPALVDGPLLPDVVCELERVGREIPVVFPVHPRTSAALAERRLSLGHGVTLLPPLGYLDFLGLMQCAAGVLTDSGGVQEETTVLGVPCFTLRANTERPVTVEAGTNRLLGLDPTRIAEIPASLVDATRAPRRLPDGWDGRAAMRLVDVVDDYFAAV